jgi:hypothetical protein
MSRDHETANTKDGTHVTKHSYPNADVRRSHDRGPNGEKINDHWTDQNTGETYYAQDTTDGKHKAGDVTDKKGNFIRNNNTHDTSSFWNS